MFTFGFTGAPQSLTIPAQAVVTITADGAGGADNTGTSCSVTGTGGTGARVVTTLPQTTAPTTVTAFRTAGTHIITAVYSGDSVYQDNSANPETITVTVTP
ncbi:hypothetical protein GCM10010519_52780 [Streptomyces lactacystinicus]